MHHQFSVPKIDFPRSEGSLKNFVKIFLFYGVKWSLPMFIAALDDSGSRKYNKEVVMDVMVMREQLRHACFC